MLAGLKIQLTQLEEQELSKLIRDPNSPEPKQA